MTSIAITIEEHEVAKGERAYHLLVSLSLAGYVLNRVKAIILRGGLLEEHRHLV